jgi:hypothetical protein
MRSLPLVFLFALSMQAQTIHFNVDSTATDGDVTVNTGGGADGICLSFSGHCTLQAAMNEINSDAAATPGRSYAIDFDPCVLSDATIDVGGFELNRQIASLTINGLGARHLMLNGVGRAFFYNVSSSTAFTLRNITLSGGGTWDGDAAIQSWGPLELDGVVIRYHAGAWGGAVYVGSTATTPGVARILNSTLYGNYAFNGGTGIWVTHNGGTVPSEVFVANTTISGNYAHNGGAALAIQGHATIRNATITQNQTDYTNGGAIALSGFDSSLDIGNTIVAGNLDRDVPDIFIATEYSPAFIDSGHNLIGDSRNDINRLPTSYAPSDILNTDALLSPLQDNGGPTPTHALLALSRAMNAGDNALASSFVSDQRNFQRIAGGTVDIGAFESLATELPSNPNAPPVCAPAKATPTITVTGGTYTYDGQPHAAIATVTGLNGAIVGTASITYNGSSSAPIEAGIYDVVATFAGDTSYESASGTATITINPAPPKATTTVYAGDTYLLAGAPAVLSAILTTSSTPVANQAVTLTLGGQSCNGTTDAAGKASCTVVVNQPLGPNVVSASFAGTANYLASSASANVLVYAFPAGGVNFVVGDSSARVGSNVTFWGAQWWKLNSVSGGAAPAAFKGYVSRPGAAAPSCGASWSTDPGNSSQPPSAIPSYMAVIVSSAVSQSGSNISGNVVQIAIVKTDAGYQANPGHAGTGVVVAVLCR